MADVTCILLGAPNAGKSTLFNLLTGGHAKVGNWHGVTVGASERKAEIGGRRVTVCDLPGIYAEQSMSLEEKYARDYLAGAPEARLLLVSECASLPRSLPLFAALAQDRRAVLLLTKGKTFRRAGGAVDCAALSRALGVPVLDAEAGRKALKQGLAAFLSAPRLYRGAAELPEGIYTPPREGLCRADRFLLNGFICIPLFFVLLAGIFFLTFAPNGAGDAMKSAVEKFFGEYLAGKAARIPSPVLRSFFADGLLKGTGSVLCFLPQIGLLYLFLTVLEESGLFSRLAILTDGFFSKLGLSGRAAFSLLLGFGCSAAAILTTRSLEDKSIQRRTVLALPYISCSAKLPVYLTLSASFFADPFVAVVLLYALGVGMSLLVSVFLRTEPPPFVLELAPLQIPRPVFVLKTLFFQLRQFIIKVATAVTAFFLLSWVLSSFDFSFALCGMEQSMLARLCSGLSFLFAPAGMNDWRIAYAALSGLIAKENVAGALAMFYGAFPYSPQSAFALAVFVLACSPCVSAIAATARELGWKRAGLYALMQTVTALLLSYAVYFALTGGAPYICLALAVLFALMLVGRENLEGIRRKRGRLFKKLHR